MIYSYARRIWSGESFVRILMNDELRRHTVGGRVLDVGGGTRPTYFKYLQSPRELEILTIDMKEPDGSMTKIDLEIDPFPYDNNSVDQVLMFNLLEHIYNYRFVVAESRRVLQSGGQLIGFVPFLINYHPDPHDYFRYTKEALKKILETEGFKDVMVKSIGRGPIMVNYNNIMLSLPRFLRVLLFVGYNALDKVFLRFRPAIKERYPLGYIFLGKK